VNFDISDIVISVTRICKLQAIELIRFENTECSFKLYNEEERLRVLSD
jgi:hypothetical protein